MESSDMSKGISGRVADSFRDEARNFDFESGGALPLSLDEVTPEWLTAVLSERHPGVEVSEVEIENGTEGTASRYPLRLTYASNGAELPNRMFLKSAFHDWRAHLAASGIYESEARFYSELRDALDLRTCEAFASVWDPDVGERGQFALLLDDLGARSCTFGHATRPLSSDQVERTLEVLASLHARWWHDPVLSRLGWVQGPLEMDRQAGSFKRIQADVPDRLTERGHVLPLAVADADRIVAAFWSLQAVSATEHVALAHGDPHLGNFYFEPSGSPGLLDWQMVRRVCFMHDVAYHLGCALTIEDRRSAERDLIAGYLSGLEAKGADPVPFDEAWDLYRQHFAYGLFVWLINPGDFQLDETNLSNLERMGAAVADHGTFEMLGI